MENIYTKPTQMRIYLNTPSHALGRQGMFRIASMVFTWCKKNLGVNKRKAFDPIWSFSSLKYGNLVGDYDDIENEITIYYKNVEDVRDLISTCIHEWTHQNQPCRSKYNKWKGSYRKHPLEVEAYAAEALYTSPCWSDIKGKVNK
jgi:hypothetical protein